MKEIKIDNNVKESYCSFEAAMLLKEAGFAVPCSRFHNVNDKGEQMEEEPRVVAPMNHNHHQYGTVSIPRHGLAREWLRVNFAIWISSRYSMTRRWTAFVSYGYDAGAGKMITGNDSPAEAFDSAIIAVSKELIEKK